MKRSTFSVLYFREPQGMGLRHRGESRMAFRGKSGTVYFMRIWIYGNRDRYPAAYVLAYEKADFVRSQFEWYRGI